MTRADSLHGGTERPTRVQFLQDKQDRASFAPATYSDLKISRFHSGRPRLERNGRFLLKEHGDLRKYDSSYYIQI